MVGPVALGIGKGSMASGSVGAEDWFVGGRLIGGGDSTDVYREISFCDVTGVKSRPTGGGDPTS